MKSKYKHTNIVARDWERLSEFYEKVFRCVRVPPERRVYGAWLERGTGVAGAELSGVHLRLPGYGEEGPTLEIYRYSKNEDRLPPAANREGLAHIAFEVEDVEAAVAEVLKHGGAMVGEVASAAVEGVGTLEFVYLADPEGNIIEVQAWR